MAQDRDIYKSHCKKDSDDRGVQAVISNKCADR